MRGHSLMSKGPLHHWGRSLAAPGRSDLGAADPAGSERPTPWNDVVARTRRGGCWGEHAGGFHGVAPVHPAALPRSVQNGHGLDTDIEFVMGNRGPPWGWTATRFHGVAHADPFGSFRWRSVTGVSGDFDNPSASCESVMGLCTIRNPRARRNVPTP